ncbi:sugar-phosphatase [Friedmanniella endophytica]|uniref:Sugar-phosphatase n=1 Tax=Microlunatus kandeliicorticis TaxID=1759536 RepID=A0A7W3P532_9ACTN|nr:HAD-IA family hydrolase [Microlunatus kandeliicorticis]MBA8793544.1 sugar-phosphatase [Microlunatus kandeliicorticis]
MARDLTATDFAAVIFDMDGTLIDSTPAVLRSWSRWAEENGLPAERLQGFHGVPSAGVVRAVLPAERVDAGIARIDELELTDVEDIVVLPGANEAFRTLPHDQVAIATSCNTPLARARIEASGLEAPAVLVTASDVVHGKPAPDPFLLAAERLGVDPTECLVVEDAPKGLIAAKAAGCATLAVVTTTPRDELDADLVVGDLSAVTWSDAGGRIRLHLVDRAYNAR